MLLRPRSTRTQVWSIYRSLVDRFPACREDLRVAVLGVIEGERTHWKQLPEEDLQEIERLHHALEDASLAGRLRQHVGRMVFGQERSDLSALAAELLTSRETLESVWTLITSGNAAGSWDLGIALARLDAEEILLKQILRIPGCGRDRRVIAAYLTEASALRHDKAWLDTWIDRIPMSCQEDADLVIDLTWRCTPTDAGARRLARILSGPHAESEQLPLLGYGSWSVDLPSESFALLASRLITGSLQQRAVATILVEHRITRQPDEKGIPALNAIMLRLALDGEIASSEGIENHCWSQIASEFVASHTRDITRVIFQECTRTRDRYWSLRRSSAEKVLRKCIEADPSGVWLEMIPYLEEKGSAFGVGIPEDLLEEFDHQSVLEWIAALPATRATRLARMLPLQEIRPGSLAEAILGCYGNIDRVAGEFHCAYLSGGWVGDASTHWDSLAERLDQFAYATSATKAKDWAASTARDLRRMAEKERAREAEEQIRDR